MTPPETSETSAPAPMLWIVTPIYHDAESFTWVRERVLDVLPDGCGVRGPKFVAIDDAAGDPQVAELGKLEDVIVIRPPFNLGHQRALVHGLRSIADDVADTDVVITMDADGEDRPEDVPRMLDAMADVEGSPGRLVVARRTKRKESLLFKLFYTGFRMLFRTLTGRFVRSGNFAAFDGRYLVDMLEHPYFDLCYSAALISLSPDLVYVPCERGTRYAGHSRMGYERLLAHGVRMLMPFADRIAIRSLAFFAGAATITVAIVSIVAIGQGTGRFDPPTWMLWLLAASAVSSGLALVNFLVLFSGFVQSMALAMVRIDPPRSGGARGRA
jgi:hypothetical protein